jgi:ketosteroid isomerase-like protein
MRSVRALIVGLVLCAELASCGGGSRSRSETAGASAGEAAAARPASINAPAYPSHGGATKTGSVAERVRFVARLPRADGDLERPWDHYDGGDGGDGSADKDNDAVSPESFRYPDGDEAYNFQYGRSASASEKRTLVGVLARYFGAARAADSVTACALLLPDVASTVTASLVEHARRAPGETCETAMSAVFARTHKQLLGTLEVVYVRTDRKRAEIVFGSKTMDASYIFLARYGSAWRVEDPLPSALP